MQVAGKMSLNLTKENGYKTWRPDYLYYEGAFRSDWTLTADAAGRIVRVGPVQRGVKATRLKGQAMLPGLVNAHSHAFQRVIRGRTEARTNAQDSFWTWREQMYHAACKLSPDDIYTASRMAFLEMVLGGITAVGEFHYLHHTPDGTPYDNPNELALQVIAAARDIGLRIALLRVAYFRAGHNVAPNPRQARFIEPDTETYLKHTAELAGSKQQAESQQAESQQQAAGSRQQTTDGERHEKPDFSTQHLALSTSNSLPAVCCLLPAACCLLPATWIGVAPHSVRAVPLAHFKAVADWAQQHNCIIHSHIAEQPAEIAACVDEYGRGPVQLLATEGILSSRFTGVHGIHVNTREVNALAATGATVCVCPTTERNLGDGIAPVDRYFAGGVRLALGTDSHAQIDLLEDAREMEYHLRLQNYERAILAPTDDAHPSALAARLFDCATLNGAHSLGYAGGVLEVGRAADFFTVDLNDPMLSGADAENLLAHIVFTLSRAAVHTVCVGGEIIVKNRRHARQSDVVQQFIALQKNLWV